MGIFQVGTPRSPSPYLRIENDQRQQKRDETHTYAHRHTTIPLPTYSYGVWPRGGKRRGREQHET
jgi:hypothetical protein